MSERRDVPYTINNPKFWPRFLIEQHHDLWSIFAFIQSNTPDLLNCPGADANQYLIAGPAADLLYLCLTGHRYGTPGSWASAEIARAARAHLQAIAPTPGGYWLAGRIVAHWGEEIWPEMKRPAPERKYS